MSKSREILLSILLIVSSLAFTFGAAELFLRTILFTDLIPDSSLRVPWRYADAGLDDDFWKLAYLFGTDGDAEAVGYVDPELGWGPDRSSSANTFKSANGDRPILFYGDSFVGGANNIPQKLDNYLSDRTVLNYGVGGYGVDQIYLNLTKTAHQYDMPLLLIGILTYDLDRSVLAIRTHQKPYYDLVGGELVLRNTPILPTTSQYIEQNPLQINSYFLRFVLFRAREFFSDGQFNELMGYTEKEEKKRTINFALIEAMQRNARSMGVRPRIVLFYKGEEINTPTWREAFLKETLATLGIEYFDTRQYLLDYMSETGTALESLYRENFGHLNQEGRLVVARGLADWIEQIE